MKASSLSEVIVVVSNSCSFFSGQTALVEITPLDHSIIPGTQHRRDLELQEWEQRRHQDDQRHGAALLCGKAGELGLSNLKRKL